MIVNVFALLKPVLPALSDCCAWAVYVPVGSAGDPSTVQLPPACVAVSVCTGLPVALVPT